MPTKRIRRARHRLPSNFAAIGLLELTQWAVYGPIVGEDPTISSTRTVYPDWETWGRFYGEVRDEYLAGRRAPGTPACERIFEVVKLGLDPASVLEELRQEREDNDPRKYLWEFS